MPGYTEAVQALRDQPHRPDHLTNADLTTEDGVGGETSTVATFKAQRTVALQDGKQFDLDLMAYESKTTDGSAGDSETFDLTHGVVDSSNVAEDVIVYVVGTGYLASGDFSVDYDANTVTFSDSGTNNDVHLFYVASQQAQVTIRKVAPGGETKESIEDGNLALINRQDQQKRPLQFDFDHPLQGVIPEKWEMHVVVDAPYPVVWGVDTNNDGRDDAEPREQLIDLPINRARTETPAFVANVVASAAATR